MDGCSSWWPECSANESAKPFKFSFDISDTCKTHTSSDDCRDPCVWENDTCVTAGLFAKDPNGVFMVDTGSSIASLRPSFCEAQNITTQGRPIIRNYVGWKNVYDTPTKYPTNVLGLSFHPTCADRDLSYVPSGGLIGVAPTPEGTDVANASYMDKVPVGSRTLTFDKTTGKGCFGCPVEGGEPFTTPTSETTFVQITRGDKRYVLDTGNTETKLLGANTASPICLVGYTDMTSMAINYDTMTVKYDFDEDKVSETCWGEKN